MSTRFFTILILCLFFTGQSAEAQSSNFGSVNVVQTRVALGEVEIIIEADTYIPSFYRGRAEPTSGNSVRATAIPLEADPSSLTYRWRVNGQPISGDGQTITFPAPIGDNFTLEVTVLKNGTFWSEKGESIALSTPEVLFYEENALRGIGTIAIKNDFSLIGAEASVTAEPFFVGNGSQNNLRGNWKIDDTAITTTDWRKLTFIRPEEPNAKYLVELNIFNRVNLNEQASNSFNLHLEI
ncbi:hypothetical protein H6788_01555 [Candidatus Nomurabacteria bacterium]|nr:hypothetical protein [Candidatus Nomurabacteria bacterium]MCB9819616.1 hypothetical protein [Candidatus Nomurabacteria bacterium]